MTNEHEFWPSSIDNRSTEMGGTVVSGPIPSPKDLEAYDRVVPGSAERLIELVETAQRHRIELDMRAVESERIVAGLGRLAAIFSLLIITGAATILFRDGLDAPGYAMAILTPLAYVIVHIIGYNSERREIEDSSSKELR